MAMTFKPSTNGVNPRRVGLWRDETRGGGFVLRGNLWRGEPQLRICVNNAGEIWLVQVQSYAKESKTSLNLRCSWSLNSEHQLALIEIEDSLLLNVEDLSEVQAKVANGPAAEITFAELPPQVAINNLLAARRAAGLSETFKAKTATQPQTQTPNYKTEEGEEKKESASVATPVEGEENDDVPF